MKYPHFFPVSRKCKVPETRKKLEIAYQSRCLEENTKILEELIELRQEQAEMLGYESHAHYIQVHIWYVLITVFQRAVLEFARIMEWLAELSSRQYTVLIG